jgi:hypothetical protein
VSYGRAPKMTTNVRKRRWNAPEEFWQPSLRKGHVAPPMRELSSCEEDDAPYCGDPKCSPCCWRGRTPEEG